MIDATTFPDAEAAVALAIKAALPAVYVSNTTPDPIPERAVTTAATGNGARDWGTARANVAITVYAATERDCRELVREVQDALAVTSNDLLAGVATPAGGGVSIPDQAPPFRRYFVVTAHLRGQAAL